MNAQNKKITAESDQAQARITEIAEALIAAGRKFSSRSNHRRKESEHTLTQSCLSQLNSEPGQFRVEINKPASAREAGRIN